MLRRIALVIALVAGCTTGASGGGPREPTGARAPDVLAPTQSLAETGTPEVRALVQAVQAVDADAEAGAWLAEADASFPTAMEGRPPATVERAWDALVAWDAGGGGLALPCKHVDIPIALALLPIARTALADAKDERDPLLRAAVHLGGELGTPSNALVVVAVGANIWKAAEEWRALHGRAAGAALARYAPTAQSLLEAGRTDMRCTIAMARAATREAKEWTNDLTELEAKRRELRMPLGDDWFEDDLAQYAAFWTETEELLDTVTSLDALRALYIERRRSALAHVESALVRMFGALLINERIPRVLTELEAVIAAPR